MFGKELGCSLVVQRLPSMCEALGSIPAPKKKRQKKKCLGKKCIFTECTHTFWVTSPSTIEYENFNIYVILGIVSCLDMI
jgi:hypothetical protein